MAAEDENREVEEREQPQQEGEEQPDEAAEAEKAQESDIEDENPLAYIDISRGQRSKAKNPKDGLDEAVVLLQGAGSRTAPTLQKTRETSPS